MTSNDRQYFDDPEERFTCPRCWWSGARSTMAFELFDALAEVVTYPTADQIREAALAGNAEAIGMLERIEESATH